MIRRAGWPPVSRFSTTNCPNHVESAYCKCVANFSFSPWVEVIFSMCSIVFSRFFIVFEIFQIFFWLIFQGFWFIFQGVSLVFPRCFIYFSRLFIGFWRFFIDFSRFFIDLSTVLVDFSMVLIHFSTTLIVFLHFFNFFLNLEPIFSKQNFDPPSKQIGGLAPEVFFLTHNQIGGPSAIYLGGGKICLLDVRDYIYILIIYICV